MAMVLSSPPRFMGIDEYFLFDGTYWENSILFSDRCAGVVYTTSFLNNEELQVKVMKYKILSVANFYLFSHIECSEASKSWYCDSEKYLNMTWEVK